MGLMTSRAHPLCLSCKLLGGITDITEIGIINMKLRSGMATYTL
jgi:hypothetical protein